MKHIAIIMVVFIAMSGLVLAQDGGSGCEKQSCAKSTCAQKASCANKCASCPGKMANNVMKIWQDITVKAADLTDEQRQQKRADYKTLTACPCIKVKKQTKAWARKALHTNWHFYKILKASCPGCKDLPEGEMCTQCKKMMAKMPKELAQTFMVRYQTVSMMCKVANKIGDVQSMMQVVEPIECDAKDLAAVIAMCKSLTAEGDELIATWKKVPEQHAAMADEEKQALKAVQKKLHSCPLYKAYQATNVFFTNVLGRLVKCEQYLAKKCPVAAEQGKEFQMVYAAFAACGAMNIKANEVLTWQNKMIKKSMAN